MNLGQLRTAVYANIGSDPNDGLLTPTAINSFINRALHSLEQEAEWPWLEMQETINVVAGTTSYTPGASGGNWLRTRWLEDQNGKNMEWFSHVELDDRYSNSSTGQPKTFSVYGDQINIRPIPDGSYTLTHFYQRSEADLVNDTDTPVIPATYHTLIVDYASYLAFRASRETERANEALQAYKDSVKQMWSRAKRRVDLPGKVRVRPGSWL